MPKASRNRCEAFRLTLVLVRLRSVAFGCAHSGGQEFRVTESRQHPALHFYHVGRYWSARVGLHYRALAVDAEDGVVGSGLAAMLTTTNWLDKPKP